MHGPGFRGMSMIDGMRLPLATDSRDKLHILWWLVWIVPSHYHNWRKIFRTRIMFLSFGLLAFSFVPGQYSWPWPTSVTISRLGSFYGYAFNDYRPPLTRKGTQRRVMVLIVCGGYQVTIIGFVLVIAPLQSSTCKSHGFHPKCYLNRRSLKRGHQQCR